MGQSPRPVPVLLAKKLRLIRTGLQLSQNELISHLGLADELTQARVSAYERGVREPALLTAAKICTCRQRLGRSPDRRRT
jgi:transcriptional regulator with XRE-family HTH domain